MASGLMQPVGREMNSTLPALDSPEWIDILARGLGARSSLVEAAGARVWVSVFRAGPFSVAYPDFPVGADFYASDVQEAIMDVARGLGADVVRFHSMERLRHERVLKERLLGTCMINELQSWNEAAFEKARRTRNRMKRNRLAIESPVEDDGARLHQLYLGTLGRHRGSARYGVDYFKAIAPFATLVAKHQGTICAFVCFAALGRCAYYLHGAIDPQAKALYPSDQLFHEMINCSKANGAGSLDFLPSPPQQSSLVRYKESWGGRSAPYRATDIAVHPTRALAFEAATHIANWLPGKLLSYLFAPRRHGES